MALPERPTPIEKFVQLIPLRYSLAVLAWVIILDPVGFGVANYVQSGAVLQFPNPENAIFGVLLNFYLFYIVRYLRLRVVKAEPQIAPIMAGGEGMYHSVFGRTSNTRSIIYLAAFLEALTLLATPHPALSLVEFYNRTTQVILIVAFATLIWEYSAASWGLHKLGESQLNLKSFLEDRFFGARSVGNLALSLTIAYLGGLLLFFLDSVTFLPVFSNPGFESFYLILLGLGVVMFFLPLNSIHGKMQSEKAEHQRALGRKLVALREANRAPMTDGPASLERLETGIQELVRMKDLEMTERKLSNTATWPFDAQLLARLIAIILSITAVLLARIIVDLISTNFHGF